GSSSQPFAQPGDVVGLTLDSACHGASPGFSGATDDQVVTVLFTPPHDGPRNAVVLSTDCSGVDPFLDACASNGGLAARPTCLTANTLGQPTLERVNQRTLRFGFPDTDSLLLGLHDDLTFSGPATIVVTPRGGDLHCELAQEPCSPRNGLLAC